MLLLIFGSLTAIVLFLFLSNRLLKEKDEKSADINVENVITEGERSHDVDLTFASEKTPMINSGVSEGNTVMQDAPARKVDNYFNMYYLGVETPILDLDPDYIMFDN